MTNFIFNPPLSEIHSFPNLKSMLAPYESSFFSSNPLLNSIWKGHMDPLTLLLPQPKILQTENVKVLHEKDATTKGVDINETFTPHRLSPLHLAVMLNSVVSVKKLLEAGANPNIQDIHGWTPMHHSAVGSYPWLIDLLRNAPNVQHDLKTDTEATYNDYLEMLSLLSKGPLVNCLHYLDPATSQIVSISSQKFKELTGAEFLPKTYATRELLYHEWNRLPSNADAENDAIEITRSEKWNKKKYEEYIASPPKLYLAEEPVLKLKGLTKQFFGVFANETIPKGKIITEYTGIASVKNKKALPQPYFPTFSCPVLENRDYRFNEVDGLNYRNLGPMVNHSFPNSSAETIVNHKGLKYRYVLISKEDIKQGEQILWNTNHQTLQLISHFELSSPQIDKFVKKHPIKTLKNILYDKFAFVNKECEPFQYEQALYLLSSISFIMSRYLANDINVRQLTEIGKSEQFGSSLLFQEKINIVGMFTSFDKVYFKLEPKVKEEVKNQALGLIHEGLIAHTFNLLNNPDKVSRFTSPKQVKESFASLKKITMK